MAGRCPSIVGVLTTRNQVSCGRGVCVWVYVYVSVCVCVRGFDCLVGAVVSQGTVGMDTGGGTEQQASAEAGQGGVS